MAPRVHASTFFRGRERAELAPCQHISQSLLNGEQSLQSLPSTQRDAETQGDLGEREVRGERLQTALSAGSSEPQMVRSPLTSLFYCSHRQE